VEKVIGVHFKSNSSFNAVGTVGIEIEIQNNNGIQVVQSNSSKRFVIKSYDESTNFCMAEEYNDVVSESIEKMKEENFKDLLMSELFELKNIWYMYTKKINSLLVILPQEILSRYDMVAKTLQMPVFDITKYGTEENPVPFKDIFNEIVFKMGQYYFSIFQALFSKDNEAVRPQIQDFLEIKDAVHRSRKLISYFEELHSIIDQKLFYVQKMNEELKERQKTNLLEQAYQKVLEDGKQSDKAKYQQKLDAIVNMPENVRKTLQEELNLLEQRNDTDNTRRVIYLNNVFRLPWDKTVDPYWDVHYSKAILDKSHYGMVETKERILEFIAKNKRINS